MLIVRTILAVVFGLGNHLFYKTDVSLNEDYQLGQRVFSLQSFIILNLFLVLFTNRHVDQLQSQIQSIVKYQGGEDNSKITGQEQDPFAMLSKISSTWN